MDWSWVSGIINKDFGIFAFVIIIQMMVMQGVVKYAKFAISQIRETYEKSNNDLREYIKTLQDHNLSLLKVHEKEPKVV